MAQSKYEERSRELEEKLEVAEQNLNLDPENFDLWQEANSLRMELKSLCRTCGKEGHEMYDCHGIYAGTYCSEECCPIRMDHYTQADVDEDIEPHDGEIW